MLQHLFVWLIVAMTAALAGMDARAAKSPWHDRCFHEFVTRSLILPGHFSLFGRGLSLVRSPQKGENLRHRPLRTHDGAYVGIGG
jgi:hypothetical protein